MYSVHSREINIKRMKQIVPFIRKEFYHILRDTKTLLILFVMPIVLVILFGFAIRTEIKDTKIAILDHAKDELSIDLTNKLLSTGYFICDKNLSSTSEIEPIFKQGDISLVIVFPKDFSKLFYIDKIAPIQIITDATDINSSTILKSYVRSIVENFRAEKTRAYKSTPPIDTTIRMIYNPEMKDIYMFVPGVLALVLMLVLAIMTAVSLTKEKEMGTLKILIVSPLRTIDIIIGKIVPYLFIAIINTIMILGLSAWIFDMPIHGSYLTLSFVCLLFLSTSLSLGVLISAIASTQQVALFISMIALFLPTMLLSGFIYPIENMPLPLQVISNIFPAKWFIIAIKAVMLKGSSITQILFPLGIMALMTIVFIRVSIMKYKKIS